MWIQLSPDQIIALRHVLGHAQVSGDRAMRVHADLIQERITHYASPECTDQRFINAVELDEDYFGFESEPIVSIGEDGA